MSFHLRLFDSILLQKLPGDDETLDFAGAFADEHERGVAVVAFDVELSGVAEAAMNAHGFERDLLAYFRGKELCHARLKVAARAAILLLRGLLHEQARRLDMGCHVRQLHLDSLMLSDWPAKAGTLLRVADGLVEGGLRHADGAGGHVDASDLQAAHGMLETLALFAAQQVRRRDAHGIEDQFRRLHTLVAKLLEAAPRAQPRCFLLHKEDAHAAMRSEERR